MGKIIALFTILFITIQISAQQYNFFEGDNNMPAEIEDSNGNLWEIGVPGKFYLDQALSGTNALITKLDEVCPPGTLSRVQFTMDFSDWGWWPFLVFQFNSKMHTDPAHSGGWIEFSFDQGDSWYNVFDNEEFPIVVYGGDNPVELNNGEMGWTGIDNYWNYTAICFAVLYWEYPIPEEPENILIRFNYYTDMELDTSEGWMIDDVMAYEEFFHTVEEMEEFNRSEPVYIYPNPVIDYLRLFYKLNETRNISLRLVDMQGRLIDQKNIGVKEKGIYSFTWEDLELEALPQLFLLEFQVDDKVIVERIVNGS